MTNYLDLTGKVALITGASSGIGAATARVFGDLGARIALGYHRNEAGAFTIRDGLRAAGTEAIAVRSDVRNVTEVRAAVDAVAEALGPIDILVNNAGSLVERQKIADLTEQRLDEIFDLNLKSAVFAAQAVVPSMIARRRGVIINVVSIAGHNGGGPGASAYASSKAALTAYTKGLAKELAPSGIRVNAIAPGVIDTPFHEVFSTPEMLKNFVAAIPLGRVGRSDECATVIAFLASEAASYMVGETVDVNGGLLMR